MEPARRLQQAIRVTSGPRARVTVLLPVWNGAAHLRAALDSVLAQTLREFECLVIDDGSTDATAAILAEYQRRDARVRVMSESHRGLVAVLNRGLDEIQTEYVARMDADDLSEPERLAAQVAFMDRHPRVGLCGGWVRPEGGSPRRAWRQPVGDAGIRSGLLFGCTLFHPTVILRRRCFQDLRYDAADVHCEDYGLWIRCARRADFELANLPRVLVGLRRHAGAVSRQFETEQRRGSGRLRAEQLRWVGANGDAPELAVHEIISSLGGAALRGTSAWLSDDLAVAAGVWLARINAANQRHGRYDSAALARQLVDRWSRVCLATAGPRFSVWQRFWRSPLARWGLPDLRTMTALLIAGTRASQASGGGT